jgi:hypothetical protein
MPATSANTMNYVSGYNAGRSNLSETDAIILGSILGGTFGLGFIIACLYWISLIYNKYCNKASLIRRKRAKEEKEINMKKRLEEQIEYTAKIRNITIEEARQLDKSLLHPIELVPICTRPRTNNTTDTIIEVPELEQHTDKIIKSNIEEDIKREKLGLKPKINCPAYSPNPNIIIDNTLTIKEETIV